MKIVARAPLRIDFAGGWTDVPLFADSHGGKVTAAAISSFVSVELHVREGGVRLTAHDRAGEVLVSANAARTADLTFDGALDLHKATAKRVGTSTGFDLASVSQAPVGSGLGGSGALGVALLAALHAQRGEPADASELAELAFQIETSDLGLTGGRQDQLSAALGGFHEFCFSGTGVEAKRIELTNPVISDLERHTIVAYSGQSHFSSATHDRVWQGFVNEDPEVTAALLRMRDLAGDAARALAGADWRKLAQVVDENWQQQQRLHPTIASERTNQLESVARSAGAWGVKATGAGAGGCLLIVCDAEDQSRIVDALVDAGSEILAGGYSSQGVIAEARSLDS